MESLFNIEVKIKYASPEPVVSLTDFTKTGV